MAQDVAEMVLAYDMERRLLFANPAVESLTGYTVEELKAAHFICWIHPEDRERMLDLWERLFGGKPYYEEEYRLITKDGRNKWAIASWGPIVDDDGRQVGVQGRERDVTQRKMAEATLRHSEEKHRQDEERYRVLFENSPFPMWEEDFSELKTYLGSLQASGIQDLRKHLTANRDDLVACLGRVRILDVNRAAREFYGAETKQELLDGLEKIFDERAFENFLNEVEALAANNSQFRSEFPVLTLAGEERLVDMIVSVVESRRHDWSRVIVSFFDITDRKRLEEQFAQSQKMESLGRLAGGIAHDFNNLLTVINGYSEWVTNRMSPDDPLRPSIEAIHNAGQQCAELTGQLLAFSRKQRVELRPLDLNRLIRESQAVLKHALGDDIEFSVLLDPGLGTIEADRGQIYQVLMNLVVNSREAMPAGGQLTLRTSNVQHYTGAREGTTTPSASRFVRIEVEDTGSGMDERTKRHLFEPFFTTKKSRQSTGLGLATVFGIVTQACGFIHVTSRPGEGTLFQVDLPRIDVPAGPELSAPLPPPEFQGSGTVLVVEDREDVRRLTCQMLEVLGYETLPASSGSQALKLLGQLGSSLQFVLTDVIMPGMNGRDLAERLTAMQPGIKVIFMSGYTGQVFPGLSGAAYLQKPFTLSELIHVIRQAMG
jgi:PAS domain S-box-containing protein